MAHTPAQMHLTRHIPTMSISMSTSMPPVAHPMLLRKCDKLVLILGPFGLLGVGRVLGLRC